MWKDEWNTRKLLIDKTLLEELAKSGGIDDRLNEAMRYSLEAGGKRLRPILLMAAADAVGSRGEDYLSAACAIEMIHTYSLIHDDLPAMDNDDLRRGKPTNHKVYGEAMAILAGDALLTLAFEVILRQRNVHFERLLAAVGEMSKAAGMGGMAGGQALDLESEGKSIELSKLKKMHVGKTGALFCASVRMGAILAGGKGEKLAALTDYAENFGLAFQITDDILDVVGSEGNLGKPIGSDARNKKATYVTLLSLEEARVLAQESVEKAQNSLADFGSEANFLRELAAYLLVRIS